MQHIEDLKNKAQRWKDQLTKTPLERALSEATSNENWNPPTKVMQEIADATYSYSDCNIVMSYIWKRLNGDNKDWRRTLKSLTVIEYLIKNGAPRCVGEFKDDLFKIRTYSDFYYAEQGADRGAAIREKAKVVIDLLSNEKLIEEERQKAQEIKSRINANNGVQGISSDTTSYQGYGSSTVASKPTTTENDYSKKYGVYSSDTNKTTTTGASNLDKYRPSQPQPVQAPAPQTNSTWSVPAPEQPQEIRKPFQEQAKRLAKPGEEWSVPQPQVQTQSQPAWNVPAAQPKTQPQPAAQQVSLLEMDDPVPVPVAPAPVAPKQVAQTPTSEWASFPPQQQPAQPFTQAIPTLAPPGQQYYPPTQQVPQVAPQVPQVQPQPAVQAFPQYQQPQVPTQFPIQQQPQFPAQQPYPQFPPAQQPYAAFQQPQQFPPQQQYPVQQQGFTAPQATFPQSGVFTAPQTNFTAPVNQYPPQQNTFPIYQTAPQQTPNVNANPNPYAQFQYQAQPSPQKDDFQEFQSASQPKNPKSLEDKLIDLSGLGKDKPPTKAPPTNQNTSSQPQGHLYTSQSELDTFQLNYNRQQFGVPQAQQGYPQQQFGLMYK